MMLDELELVAVGVELGLTLLFADDAMGLKELLVAEVLLMLAFEELLCSIA